MSITFPNGKVYQFLPQSEPQCQELVPIDFTTMGFSDITGTGAFTQMLVARGVPEDRLALIEADKTFAQMLKVRFPHARVLVMDATDLALRAGE